MKNLRDEFPLIAKNKFAYLDSSATSQQPKCVLKAVDDYYKKSHANPHRGTYCLSVEATNAYDFSRQKVADFLNAHFEEIVFTKNATEALNLVAFSYGSFLKKGDHVLLSLMEHHSMIVPWQRACKTHGATLDYIKLNNNFELDLDDFEKQLRKKPKIVGISSVSNVLGTKNNVKQIIEMAHSVGAKVLVDISQSIAHEKFDVEKMDADFVVFSGHKMYAPMGVGVLFAKEELLEAMPPFLLGGDMIEYVYEQETTFAPLPQKFEAGTQNVGGAVGLKTAINFLEEIGFDKIKEIETELTKYARAELKKLKFVECYFTSNAKNHENVISFNLKGIHPHDVASILDSKGVFVRAGNHCAQPLLRSLGLNSTCRLSLSLYNTKQDIDKLVEALKYAYEMFFKTK